VEQLSSNIYSNKYNWMMNIEQQTFHTAEHLLSLMLTCLVRLDDTPPNQRRIRTNSTRRRSQTEHACRAGRNIAARLDWSIDTSNC
jgi:predicted NAD-dependent protein-ADP-ribosyltransferase YbiA (DUF1768 family)